ncbi:MAG: hypothetical protein RLZZ618_4259 [Pseudomonadota bacterium]|jgi:translocation and assembly module TamB
MSEPLPPTDPAVADTPPAPPAPLAPPTARERRRARRRRGLWIGLIAMTASLLVVGALLFGVFWAAGTPAGTTWLLANLARVGIDVKVTGAKGTMLGDFEAEQITIRSGGTLIVIDDASWRQLRVAYTPYPSSWAALRADALIARRVTITNTPQPGGKPAGLPKRLTLPIEVHIEQVQVAELRLPGLADYPLLALQARLALGDEQGLVHRIDQLSVKADPLLITGSARIGTTGPMDLDVQLKAVQAETVVVPVRPTAPVAAGAAPTPVDARATASVARAASAPVTSPASASLPAWARLLRRDWTGELKAKGPLAAFKLGAAVSGQGQHLDATATIEPDLPWPVTHLDARTTGLDVSALWAAAPATSLSGEVVIVPLDAAKGATAGLRLSSSLTNAKPGSWGEHQLPVLSTKLELSGRALGSGPLDLRQFEALLSDGRTDAGAVRATGRWEANTFSLKAELSQLKPGVLDARLPAMVLSGPVTVSGTIPAASAASAPTAAKPASRTASAVVAKDNLPTFKGLAELSGRMIAFDRPVQLKIDASGRANLVELREFRAAAGGALATLRGKAERNGSAWQIKADAGLVEFDPRPWFPSAFGSDAATNVHRLNLNGQAELLLPDAPASDTKRPLIDRLRPIRGDARVQLAPSTLAGVPLSGELSLRHATAAEPLRATASFDAGGNIVKAEGLLAADTRGDQDRWSVDARAPAIARLAPILRLLPGVAASGFLEGLNGSLTGDTAVTGRWPDLNVQGKAQVSGLKAGALTMTQGDLRWQFGSRADAPLDIDAELGPTGWGIQQANSARLKLTGTPRAHQLSTRIELKASPPVWLNDMQGRPTAPTAPGAAPPRTLATLGAQGSLSGGVFDGDRPVDTPLVWKGMLQQLELRNSASSGPAWVSTQNVGLELHGGGAPQFIMSPGRADLFGAGLRWERIEWQPDQGVRTQHLNMQAELEPLNVAPLLMRMQPEFGWGGDLKIGGKVNIKQAGDFSADIVLQRVSGDLNVTDDSGTQPLGLTDLTLALNVENGVWNFTQGLAGKQLGVAVGAFVVRTSPQRAWPDANAPLQGVLETQVENLGTWGAWVPTGWRLGGQLRASASVGGRFGAPEYTGQVVGQDIAVRNLLQGVNLTQGAVDISLQGDTAHINNFVAKAGNGTVRITGDARLGAAPRAQLQLVADKFQLLGRVDRRIVVSGGGEVILERENLKVDGKFVVDEGLFDFSRGDAPALGSDVTVSNRVANEPPPTPVPEKTRNTSINLQIGLGDRLRLRGRGVDTGLAGEMKITTPGGNVQWNGSIRAVDGTYNAYGQKLGIDRGVISFNGPVNDPRLDIIATRPDLDVRVGVAITGTALNPRVRLFSEPEMSDIDKLSWLMLGRQSDGLGSSDTALLQRAALALLAGDNPSVTDQVLRSIGIDDLSLRQNESGDTRETFVTVGKQLSRRWFIGYERGLNATTGTWQLIYRVAQRFTLRAQSGLDNSLDVIWTWRWE